MGFGKRSNGGEHGVVYTKPDVVKSMLDLCEYTPDKDLRNIKILEPSAGEGAFIYEIMTRLYESSINNHFEFNTSFQNITAYEIDPAKYEALKSIIFSFFRSHNIKYDPKAIFTNIKCSDYLVSPRSKFDLIIGNPPYVRHEKIPEELKTFYKKNFGAFKHRSDLYIAFYEKALNNLAQNGTLCFICSNRWLKNQYGKGLREIISKLYSIPLIIDLEEADAFEEKVAAYPAITIIQNNRTKVSTKYFEVSDISSLDRIANGDLNPDINLDLVSTTDWSTSFSVLSTPHQQQLESIERQGFSIGIGVATGADAIFIGNRLAEYIENELLLPIISSKDLKGDIMRWGGNYLLNPYSSDGHLINLQKYPHVKRYLEANKAALENRHIARKNPHLWYRTIDKIDYQLTFQPKLLLPDISKNNNIFLDTGKYYPNHNIYFITSADIQELRVLGAFLMSDFVRSQLSRLSNKMNGGYVRWQSQYLRKIKIPVIQQLPIEIVGKLERLFEEKNIPEINNTINFIINTEWIRRNKPKNSSQLLFDI